MRQSWQEILAVAQRILIELGRRKRSLIISRVNSPPLGAHEKSKKELQYPAACCGVVYSFGLFSRFRFYY
jgi:hypothetical protein